MQELLASRIALTPRPVQPREAVLEVAMLGHCPGSVRLQRLLALPSALEEMRAVGFGFAVDQLQKGPLEDRVKFLYHIPVPLRSSAEFHDIFPETTSTPSQYVSVLAGDRAWLPGCVDDFFANGGKKLWIINIPEEEGQNGFFGNGQTGLWVLDNPDAVSPASFPAPNTALFHDSSKLYGLAAALIIPSLGAVTFPDLERLQIPAKLPNIPRVRLDNPDPQFLPCSSSLDDDHRERRNTPEIEGREMPPPAELDLVLQRILPWLVRYRPDIQCLMTLPLSYDTDLNSPGIDPQAIELVQQIRNSDNAHHLRHIQFLFPFLRSPKALLSSPKGVTAGNQDSEDQTNGPWRSAIAHSTLSSPVGVIAGKQASQAQTHGPWKSIAALPLQTSGLPFPPLSIAETVALRKAPGVGVLQQLNGQIQLDDERLVVPALPPEDYGQSTDMSRFDGHRSAEIMRLLGYLRRQLNRLGEQLVFNLDYRDPRPRLVLERFFRQLQQRGALRGATAEEAFHIEEIQNQEGTMIYEIMIAPALPIDRIHLTFTNQHGEWQGEVKNV